MIKRKTAALRIKYAEKHGDKKALRHFGISKATLNRYRRMLEAETKPAKLPNILFFDIETAPLTVLVWGLYRQKIHYDNIVDDWFIISWAAKWIFSGEVMSDLVSPMEATRRDDKRICKSMWRLLESADIVIAHNAQRFDLRKLNARFIQNGLNPPSPYQVIDTLKQAQKIGAFSSHRLDYLGKILANKGKIETNFNLWKKCKRGNAEALKEMETYNREDVILLEEVYMVLRPWIKSHPNLGLYMDIEKFVCANCGSDKLIPADEYATQVGLYKVFRCQNCGGLCRQRTTELGLNKRKNLPASVAR